MSLCNKFIGLDFNVLRFFALAPDYVPFARLHWLSLATDSHTLLPGHTLLLLVLLHPSKEILSTAGVLDVLNTQIDAFLDDPISVHQHSFV
jgi:hypothetical protein